MGDPRHSAYVSIDGTDCLIQEPSPFSRGWYSHKFKHAGLRYVLAVSLFTGKLTYLEGPFPCGHWSDIRIYRHNLKNYLLPGEMVVADKGYRGEPICITPYDAYEPYVVCLMGVACARHEGINGIFKQFNVLRNMYRHDLKKHSWVFKSVAVLVQLKLIQGRGTYQIINFTVPRMLNRPVRCHRENMLDVFFGNLMVNIDRVGIGANNKNKENDENNQNHKC